jgi:hypothetical protein
MTNDRIGRRVAPLHDNGGFPMPLDAMIVVAAVLAGFAVFAGTLAYVSVVTARPGR